MRLVCTGLSHKTAGVELREKLAFDDARMRRALDDLAAKWPRAEFVLLSTCNRVEVYFARAIHAAPTEQQVREWLAGFHGADTQAVVEAAYGLADTDAARHLFAVAAGLDSLVPGEPQIVAQMKQAYAAAVEARAARSVMNELFQAAFHVAKHIRTETAIGAGRVSVASVAVDCVGQIFGNLAGKCVLNVGAGKMNQLLLTHLAGLNPGKLLLANRTDERAAELAEACDGEAVTFAQLADHLAAADLVVTATGAEAPLITEKMVRRAQTARNGRPLLIIDIAVPRDVDPEAGRVDNVFLYNIDDLDRVVLKTLSTRHGERDSAEAIIDEHVRELMDAFDVRDVAPTIEALHRRLEAIAAEELADARKKLSTHDDADEDSEILRRALHRTIRRILHGPTTHLRSAAGAAGIRARIDALRELFELVEGE